MKDRCSRCERGREACHWCFNISEQDYEAICDCGLYDFGHHLLDCISRDAYKFVVLIDEDDTPRDSSFETAGKK